MRLTVGKWLAGAGYALAAIGAVPAALGVPVAAWIMVIGGIGVGLLGTIYAAMGPTPDEKRKALHERTVNLNTLENERDALNAERAVIEGELVRVRIWAENAAGYDDAARVALRHGDIASLTADRDKIDRRLSQITTELESA